MSNPYFSLLRTSWQYAGPERRQCLLVYASFIVSSLGTTANPLLYGWLVDTLQGKDAPVLSAAAIYIGSYLGLQLFTAATHGPARVLERQLAFNISRNFLNELFHQLMHLPVHWHQDHHSGATINRLKKAYGSLKNFFQNGFFYFYTFVQFFFAFGAMLYFSPLFGMVALVLGFVTIWVIFKFDKPLVRSQEEVNEKEHLFLASLTDSLSNILTVITLRLEKRMQIDLQSKFKGMVPPFQRNVRVNEWKWFSATLLTHLIYVVMVGGYIYGHYTPGETFYLGGLVALLGFVNQFTSAFARIAIAYTDILAYYTDVQTTRPIQEAYRRKHRPEESLPLPPGWKSIRIEGLNFNFNAIQAPVAQPPAAVAAAGPYAQPKQPVTKGLHNVQLHLKRGQRIALIGESGSGKSTLLALLRGLHTPLPGLALTVDGSPAYNWGGLSDTVTLFPQEPEIFENTVAYNITLGLPFPEEEVLEVCDLVCFTEVIRQLPEGLQTVIQEKGVNLSVGQKQRLALARGLLASRGSSIVLLDEPTSSIDPQTEIQVYQRLMKALADKVVISSLHHLDLLHHFDYIYVLQEGEIVEEGTYEAFNKREYLKTARAASLS